MAFEWVVALVSSLSRIPARRRETTAAYLLALMLEAQKRTQSFASAVTGKHKSQFSRLLSTDNDISIASLNSLAERAGKLAAKDRHPLASGTKWTIALIVDSTLHPRSSLHVHNAQRLHHGQGFVVGHQWTNIVVYVNQRLIPLPPIAFLTKRECRKRGVKYQTEHEHIREYLKSLRLADFVGTHEKREVVVIADSGYDDKLLERLVIDLGWDFIVSLKSCRCTQTAHENNTTPTAWRRVSALFRAVRKHAPWATIRLQTDGGKKRTTFRARKLIGRVKGVLHDVALICSEKSNGKGRRYFACTNTKAAVGALMRVYRIRWQIELFHRVVKQQLGMLDAGVSDFKSLVAHVHWVYCAYLLLHDIAVAGAESLIEKQRKLQTQVMRAPLVDKIKKISAARTQFGGEEKRETLVQAALHEALSL